MAVDNTLPTYGADLEATLAQLQTAMHGTFGRGQRALSLLLVQGDSEVLDWVRERNPQALEAAQTVLSQARNQSEVSMQIALARRDFANQLVAEAVTMNDVARFQLRDRLSQICTSPITGFPILALVLWFVLYQFVGMFAGGTVVGWLEDDLFGARVNPWVTSLFERLIPMAWLRDLFVGDYGIWTLGVTYAVALVFPIVGAFFLAFSILEDSGYFPRLAMLIDRLFKSIGLNGKAVIPIVLGFGCDTMATIVTRILETKRERLIATFLLALAVPCSAQIGLMTALLAGHAAAFWVWVGIMASIFLAIGWLTAKLLPGESARFAMDMPPLRIPKLGNVAIKTLSRMQWYFMEVLPLFVFASVVIWLGRLSGAFGILVNGIKGVTGLLGLPPESAEAFLFGFFRRDYGAAGLYRMQQDNALSGNQLLVSVVTLTIFLPCVAQFLVMKRERGLKATLAMAGFIFPFALVVGAALNAALNGLGIQL